MNSLAKRKRRFIIISLLVPTLLLLAFVLLPGIDLFRMSFTDWDGWSPTSNFIGIDNYIEMFHNKDLWMSLRNNAVYFFAHLVMIPVELAFAVLLNTKFRGAKFYKFMIFLPFIINGVAISYAFSYFFSPVNGAFDGILKGLGMGGLIQNWLSDPKIVNFVLAFVSLWKYSGYHVTLFLAALQSVPQDMQEAAHMDGANAWQMFRFIQVPSIGLMVDFILFDNIRGALQAFDVPFVMTQGGPGFASSTFTLFTINTAFKYSNFGLAATMAVALVVLIIIVYLIQNKLVHTFANRGRK